MHAALRRFHTVCAQVLPDAVHRGGRGYQADFFAGETVTVAAPLDTLFDVDRLLAWGSSVGVVLHKVLLWAPADASLDLALNWGGCATPVCSTQ